MKSSSLPIITSTSGASLRFTSCAPCLRRRSAPEAGPVVEIVRDDGAVARGGGDRLGRPPRASSRRARRRSRPCGTSARPASPKRCSQSTSPGRSCEAAVWPRSETPTAPRTPKPRSVKLSPLRTARPAAVRRHPADQRGVDAALEHEVLEQPADLVVGERGHDGRPQPEAAAQAAGHVVLAPALPDAEPPGGADPPLARIEPQHDLAERDEVEARTPRPARSVSPLIVRTSAERRRPRARVA